LKEDIGRGDITTGAIVHNDQLALGTIYAKEDGILCGVGIAEMVFRELDNTVDFQAHMTDGMVLSPGLTIATVCGPASTCLRGERTALNFLQHLSGIATLTRKFVESVRNNVKILDTRKTLPGLRVMEKYAVRTGGGHNHRFGLHDMILIKDNHIEIAGGIVNAVERVRSAQRRKRFIEVEVKTFEELQHAVAAGVDRIMLDNMNALQIARAAEIIRSASDTIEIEVSGGITLETVKELAECGVDFISVGALTHSADALDISMRLKLLGQGES
jgi:nicotinate-nucleotide pyrophosphorylase (carboxylating)